MVACLSPNDTHFEENLSTLHYATTTGRIKNRPEVNLDPTSALIRKLRLQVRALQEQLSAAHAYIVRVTGRPLPPELDEAASIPTSASRPAASAAISAAAQPAALAAGRLLAGEPLPPSLPPF